VGESRECAPAACARVEAPGARPWVRETVSGRDAGRRSPGCHTGDHLKGYITRRHGIELARVLTFFGIPTIIGYHLDTDPGRSGCSAVASALRSGPRGLYYGINFRLTSGCSAVASALR